MGFCSLGSDEVFSWIQLVFELFGGRFFMGFRGFQFFSYTSKCGFELGGLVKFSFNDSFYRFYIRQVVFEFFVNFCFWCTRISSFGGLGQFFEFVVFQSLVDFGCVRNGLFVRDEKILVSLVLVKGSSREVEDCGFVKEGVLGMVVQFRVVGSGIFEFYFFIGDFFFQYLVVRQFQVRLFWVRFI